MTIQSNSGNLTLPLAQAAQERRKTRLSLDLSERRILLGVMDILLLCGSLLVAVVLWNGFDPATALSIGYAKWYLTLALLWLFSAAALDAFDLARAASVNAILGPVLLAGLGTTLVYLIIPWLTPPIQSRSYGFGLVALGVLSVTGWRIFYAVFFHQPAFYRRVLLLAPPNLPPVVADLLGGPAVERPNPYRGTGYEVLGVVIHDSASDGEQPVNPSGLPWPVVGKTRDLVHVARSLAVDEIVLAYSKEEIAHSDLFELLLDCQELGFRVYPFPAIHERLGSRLPVEYAVRDAEILLCRQDPSLHHIYLCAKWLMDQALGLLGLVALLGVSPLVWLANRLSSPGPLFYHQQRIGHHGRPIVVWKFRTMVVDAEKYSGAVWSSNNDPRITRIGRFLRRSRLDELPQVINVLRGEMSFVGPRPERPELMGPIMRELPVYRLRHAVKPGITGWAQVSYRYGNSVEDSRIKLEYDLYYVKHAGLLLDLLILLKTVSVVLGLRGQ